MEIIEDHAQFFTASILDHKHLLAEDKYKHIIVDSLSFLSREGRVYIYAFVIMSNHIHLIWQSRNGYHLRDIQRDFLKYTAQQFRFYLIRKEEHFLQEFEVNLKDRRHQFWQRSSLNVPVYSSGVFEQKINYIHQNPVKAGLSKQPENYRYSSASFYYLNDKSYDFLTHYRF